MGSDMYKIMFTQMCPSCKMMIERSEGCKFMECAKCKYQFCWLCLSEYYTEYHYYESLCPMRAILIFAVPVMAGIFLDVKLIFTFSAIALMHWYILFYGIFIQGVSILLNWSFYELKMRVSRYKKHKSNIRKVMAKLVNPLTSRNSEGSNLRILEKLNRRA